MAQCSSPWVLLPLQTSPLEELDRKIEDLVVAYDNDHFDNVVDFLSAVSSSVF